MARGERSSNIVLSEPAVPAAIGGKQAYSPYLHCELLICQ
jgi:hypothetical protein